MVESSSVSTSAPTIDWADDTDDEIDFGAPVFSEDEDLPASMTTGLGTASTLSTDHSTEDERNLHSGSRNQDWDRSREHESKAQSGPRYTAGFADGSTHSLDRRTHNNSSLQPMSSRSRNKDHSMSYRDAPNSHPDRDRSYPSGRGSGQSYERETHWRSDGPRRDGPSRSSYGSPHAEEAPRWSKRHNDDRMGSAASGQRSGRQVIPLPPKPAPVLDANHHQPNVDRSRSPSYRSNSPLPPTERRWDNSRQRASSPFSSGHPSPSPSRTHSQHGLTTRSYSPSLPSRAHMDQVSDSREHSTRRNYGLVPDGRWEKTPHADKPYPTPAPPAAAPSPPKDDVIYFRRRDDRSSVERGSHEGSLGKSLDKVPSGIMYHERLEANDARHIILERAAGASSSTDRWEKNALLESDRPYPERSHPSASTGGKHGGARSRTLPDAAPVGLQEKSSPRGHRGKGNRDQKRKSKDQPVPVADDEGDQDKDEGSAVPWWEQSTYGKKKEESKPKPVTEHVKETTKVNNATTTSSSKSSSTKSQENGKETPKATTEAAEDVPWWELSTYKVKPKTVATVKGADGSGTDEEVMVRRKALSQQVPIAGVEALTLVSRGGDDLGSSHSIKTRSVQERVFSEIKAMTSQYDKKYGTNKLEPIPSRTQQSEAMDKILDSFRKLREGLFATEARDAFAVEVYEESVLCSLYAGHGPELTKALHHLVQELHPVVHKYDTKRTAGTNAETMVLPMERQRFLALYILHHIARPAPFYSVGLSGSITTSTSTTSTPLTQTISHPKTETDRLIASLLPLFEQHLKQQQQQQQPLQAMQSSPGLGSDLLFAMAYWKSLRENNWVTRERLLSLGTQPGSSSLSSSSSSFSSSSLQQRQQQQVDPVSWAQRRMIQLSMGDSLKTSRTMTVAAISKAYYSLPVSSMARAVGLSSQPPSEQGDNEQKSEWEVKIFKSSYALVPSIVVRDGQLLFKAKS
ncbi:hypothetical protein EDD11_005969 [Mortierella claussenii]|nr:hypothetical protein EDD11_005969 [Mortierella claussenii]